MGRRKRKPESGDSCTATAKKLIKTCSTTETAKKLIKTGDFVWAKLPSTSYLWPVKIEKVDISDDHEEYHVYCKADTVIYFAEKKCNIASISKRCQVGLGIYRSTTRRSPSSVRCSRV